jgi:hypothetical protein
LPACLDHVVYFYSDYVNLKVVNMPHNKNEPTRLELYKAGKIEDRHSIRPPHVPAAEENKESGGSIGLRPEVITIGLMLIALLILTVIAI